MSDEKQTQKPMDACDVVKSGRALAQSGAPIVLSLIEARARRDRRDQGDQRAELADVPLPSDDDAPDPREPIEISADEHIVIRASLAALEGEPNLYQRNGTLVHVVTDPERAKKVQRPDNAKRVTALQRGRLHEMLAERICYTDEKSGKPQHPPDFVVRGILDRAEWPGIRALSGVVEAPVLRADGTVLSEPGYDAATGLLLAPTVDVPEIPSEPTQADARAAVADLLDVVREFPMCSDAHRSVFLSGVLTLLARPAIAGPVPLHFIEANVRGAGKSLLVDCISLIATGRPAPRMTQTRDEDEWRKRMLSLLLAGDSLVLIDNVTGTFGDATLDAVLTSESWSDRILGKSESSGAIAVTTTFFVTGNNATLGGDLGRRTVLCRLESPLELPEERTDLRRDEDELKEFVRANRGKLLAAALTILRAWWCAGRPQQPCHRMGSFSAWSKIVRQAIMFAGEADPGKTVEHVRERADGDRQVVQQLHSAWLQSFGVVKRVSMGDVARLCWPVNMYGKTTPPDERDQPLRDVLDDLAQAKGGTPPTTIKLAKRLGVYRGRVVSGYVLESGENAHTKGLEWWVSQAGAGEAANAPVREPVRERSEERGW